MGGTGRGQRKGRERLGVGPSSSFWLGCDCSFSPVLPLPAPSPLQAQTTPPFLLLLLQNISISLSLVVFLVLPRPLSIVTDPNWHRDPHLGCGNLNHQLGTTTASVHTPLPPQPSFAKKLVSNTVFLLEALEQPVHEARKEWASSFQRALVLVRCHIPESAGGGGGPGRRG